MGANELLPPNLEMSLPSNGQSPFGRFTTLATNEGAHPMCSALCLVLGTEVSKKDMAPPPRAHSAVGEAGMSHGDRLVYVRGRQGTWFQKGVEQRNLGRGAGFLGKGHLS